MLRFMSCFILIIAVQEASAQNAMEKSLVQAICTPEYSYRVNKDGIFRKHDGPILPDRLISFDDNLLALAESGKHPIVHKRVFKSTTRESSKVYQSFWKDGTILYWIDGATKVDCSTGYTTLRKTITSHEQLQVTQSACKCAD